MIMHVLTLKMKYVYVHAYLQHQWMLKCRSIGTPYKIGFSPKKYRIETRFIIHVLCIFNLF